MIPKEDRLKPSRDRKVSPVGHDGGLKYQKWNGKSVNRGFVATVANSFGLPAGDSCPGKTEFCKSCYATNSERVFPNVGKAMHHNFAKLKEYQQLYGIDGMIELLDDVVARFVHQIEYYNLDEHERIFRIHWDGDFYSMAYAEAWAQVIRNYPDIKFWCYTRSFTPICNVVPILAPIKNLTLYLSVDDYNVEEAERVALANPTVLMALCSVDYEQARDLAPWADPLVCPENSGRMPLNNETGVGACVTCQLCPQGRRSIMFSTTHLQSVRGPQQPLALTTNEVCEADDCNNQVPLATRGRKKRFCGRKCQVRQYHRKSISQ
jgi:hypothetical protein